MTASASRKQLDDLVVAERDDKDGRCGRQRENQGKLCVLTQRQECFFGTVAGGRQVVGAEADPREYWRDGNCMARARIERIKRFAYQHTPDLLNGCHGVSRLIEKRQYHVDENVEARFPFAFLTC